jgi:hypothetical protein|tara:strand:+ start:20144 stop:21154 length:1011 start_codon:yes stop_codon:yes gene_type:complete
MDDFVISNLHEARNEWCSRLVSILTPLVEEGVRSIFDEAWKICLDSDEMNKYLMTFQNLLSRIPKWNSVIIEEERQRIIERSGCNYLEDLITCVHIIQLKVLTCIRVGNKQKKVDISIPKLDPFIHRVYIQTARKIYSNVYLFEKNVSPLQTQKNARELEMLIQEAILTTIRESIPTEAIIRAYMDESEEQEEEVTIENIKEPEITKEEEKEQENKQAQEKAEEEAEPVSITPTIKNIDDEKVVTKLTFNDLDSAISEDNKEEIIDAPKTLERLEDISVSRSLERKMMEEDDSDDDDERIKIHTDTMDLTGFDLLDEPEKNDIESANIVLEAEELL